MRDLLDNEEFSIDFKVCDIHFYTGSLMVLMAKSRVAH